MLEWRDPPPLTLTMLDRPASVAPSSTDPRGLTTVDGDALDTAVASSWEPGRSCSSTPSSLVGMSKVILPGGASGTASGAASGAAPAADVSRLK